MQSEDTDAICVEIGGVETRSDSEDSYETVRVRTARFVSMARTDGRCGGHDVVLGRDSFLARSASVLARLAGSDRAEVGPAAVAAIAGINRRRSHLLMTPLREVVASAPCAAQNGRVGSNSNRQHDRENGEPQHGDR